MPECLVTLVWYNLLKAGASFQVVQLHDVVPVQDERVGVLRAGETGVQFLHAPR